MHYYISISEWRHHYNRNSAINSNPQKIDVVILLNIKSIWRTNPLIKLKEVVQSRMTLPIMLELKSGV